MEQAETIHSSTYGDIHILYEITLGDVIVISLISCILIFMFLDRIIRR
ncbi:hypothetical protein QA612_09790 [Evansella sp. AB-P1]|nr:hypothetical protein [Evansella sp. AB-P1]MDG5787791.1 hypothetical protein [Evansella sp. AB-P1]